MAVKLALQKKGNRKSSDGQLLPSWLMTPCPVMMEKQVRHNKFEALVDEIQVM